MTGAGNLPGTVMQPQAWEKPPVNLVTTEFDPLGYIPSEGKICKNGCWMVLGLCENWQLISINPVKTSIKPSEKYCNHGNFITK